MRENICAIEKLYPNDFVIIVNKEFCRRVLKEELSSGLVTKEDLHTVMTVVNPGEFCTLYNDKDTFYIEI